MSQPLQSALQQSIRSALGCANDFNGDLHAMCDLYGIVAAPISGRLIEAARKFDSSITTASSALNYFLQNPQNACGTLVLDFTTMSSLDPRITFSRGSQATLFDSTGTLRYAKHNLALQSQDFATTWTATAVTVSTDATNSPAGTLTADKVIETAATSDHRVNQGSAALTAGQNTISVYAKAAERSVVKVQFDGTVGGLASSVVVDVNLLTGVAATPTTANNLSAASVVVHDAGNGWYRIVLTFTASASSSGTVRFFLLQSVGGASSYAGDGTSGLFLWGAQLNISNMEGGVTSSLTTYYPTTTAAYYAPRFDYNPSTLAPRGLLIEEQRTNSIRNNTMQGAVAGTPGTVPTNWGATSSTGGLTRQIVGVGIEDGISYIDVRYSGTNTSGGSLFPTITFDTVNGIAGSTGQVWAGSTYLSLAAGTGISFDLSLYEFNSGGTFLRIVSFPGATGVPAVGALRNARRFGAVTLGASTAFIQPLITGTIANGATVDFTLRIGLPQLEQGAFATSVIPTTTTALTRNADVASMTGTNFSSWYNQSAGTLFAQALIQGIATNPNCFVSIDDGTTNNRIQIRRSSPGTAANLRMVSSGGSIDAVLSSGTLTNANKQIVAFAASDQQSASNGTLFSGISSITPLPTVDRMNIGTGVGSGNVNGWISRISYYPTRLPNATLQALTA